MKIFIVALIFAFSFNAYAVNFRSSSDNYPRFKNEDNQDEESVVNRPCRFTSLQISKNPSGNILLGQCDDGTVWVNQSANEDNVESWQGWVNVPDSLFKEKGK